jgi:hypothetical protein
MGRSKLNKKSRRVNSKKSKKKAKNQRKGNKIYSMNFFYYYVEYEHDFFNWYFNDVPPESFFDSKKKTKIKMNLKNALKLTINKSFNIMGKKEIWNQTKQYKYAKYAVYYKIFKVKNANYEKARKIRITKYPTIIHRELDNKYEVEKTMRELRLLGKYKRKFKHKKNVDTFEIYKFLVREISRKYKLKRVKHWKMKGFRFLTLKH